MNTRTAFDKLPEISKKTLLHFRDTYKKAADYNGGRYWIQTKDYISTKTNCYLSGLRDAGLITDRERQLLFIYVTL